MGLHICARTNYLTLDSHRNQDKKRWCCGIHDRASVNGCCMRVAKDGGYRHLFDMACLPHTINTVGEKLDVKLAVEFLHTLVNLFNSEGMYLCGVSGSKHADTIPAVWHHLSLQLMTSNGTCNSSTRLSLFFLLFQRSRPKQVALSTRACAAKSLCNTLVQHCSCGCVVCDQFPSLGGLPRRPRVLAVLPRPRLGDAAWKRPHRYPGV
jgi:hypothetical protein